jgi:hypothetical protein
MMQACGIMLSQCLAMHMGQAVRRAGRPGILTRGRRAADQCGGDVGLRSLSSCPPPKVGEAATPTVVAVKASGSRWDEEDAGSAPQPVKSGGFFRLRSVRPPELLGRGVWKALAPIVPEGPTGWKGAHWVPRSPASRIGRPECGAVATKSPGARARTLSRGLFEGCDTKSPVIAGKGRGLAECGARTVDFAAQSVPAGYGE